MSIEEQSQQSDVETESTSVGARLRAARREQNLSEKDVADTLHITVHYVKALETDKYEKLPGPVFARGYIRSYGDLLGLDAEQLVALYGRQQADEVSASDSAAEAKKQQDQNRSWIIAGIVLFVAGLLLFWLIGNGGDETPSGAASQDRSGVDSRAARSSSNRVSPATRNAVANSAVAPTLARGLAPSPEPQVVEDTPAARQERAAGQEIPPAEAAALQDSGDTELAPAPEESDAAAETLQSGVLETQPPAPDAPLLEATPAAPGSDAPVDAGAPGPGEATAAADAPAAGNAVGDSFAAVNAPAASVSVADRADGGQLVSVQSPGIDVLRLQFAGESWVEINNGAGERIYQDLRGARDVLEVTGLAPFNLLLGDAPMVELRFNGDEVDVSGDIRVDNSARLTVGL